MINVKQWKDTLDMFFRHPWQVFEMFLMHFLLIGAAMLFLGFSFKFAMYASFMSGLLFAILIVVIYGLIQIPSLLTLNHKVMQAPMARPFSGLVFATIVNTMFYVAIFLITKDNTLWGSLGLSLGAALIMLFVLYMVFIGSRLRPGSKNFQCHIQLTWKRYVIFSIGGLMIQNLIYKILAHPVLPLFDRTYLLTSVGLLVYFALIPAFVEKRLPLLTQYTAMAFGISLDFIFAIWLIIYFF